MPGPTPQPARGGVHLVEWASELVSTAFLLLAGLSAVALDFGPGSPVAAAIPSRSARLALTGLLLAGSGSLVAVSPLGRRSGGHINPAVTLAFWVTRRVHRHDLGGYVAAQLLGALIGSAAFRFLWGGTAAEVGYGVTHPGTGVTELRATLIEAGMTATLILTIFAFVSSRRTARCTPVAVWLLLAGFVWQVAPLTGTSLNPARSLGPAVVSGNFTAIWVYLVGPVAGALTAAWGWNRLMGGGRILTAKLFHDEHYPSVLGTELPAMPPP
jgi:aquaporin Z